MRKLTLVLSAVAVLATACSTKNANPNSTDTSMTSLPTRKSDNFDVYFGHKIDDPYRWLEDDNSDETKAWVEAQNTLTRRYLDPLAGRDEISRRLTEIWNYPRKSAPFRRGRHYFYSANDGLQNQSVFYITDTLENQGRIILDPNKFSDNGTVALTAFSVSPDGKYLGYGIARNGSDWNEFYVRDIATGEDLSDHIEWIKFSSLEWYGDGFYYSRYPEPEENDALVGENIDNAVYYHKIGDDQSADRLVFADTENRNRSFGAQVFDDDDLLVLYVSESTSGNGLYTLDLKQRGATMQRIIDEYVNDYIPIGCNGRNLFVLTNDNAPRYRIISINLRQPERKNWKTIISESSTDIIESAEYENDRFFVTYMHDACSAVSIFNAKGEKNCDVELPGLGSVSGFAPYKKDNEFYYTFSSFLSPAQVYRYDIQANSSELFRATELSFDFDQYETKQIFYPSTDGTLIPMFLVHKKGITLDGSNPTWLYGYGGFNISLTPSFDLPMLLWLEHGGIYAVANLRGGGEYGEQWHQAGTLFNKQNVFDDFASAARYLIDNKYTTADLLVCQGGSNGGLLIGATVNQYPELFRVALPSVGVMDMLRYHKFTIGRYWATDYGTADDSAEMFEYLLKYSPLHNIADRRYPSILVTTADHDDRVVPAHSFKYTATLQEKYSGDRPMLIRIESQAGHGAGKPTAKQIALWVDFYSFVFNELGIKP